jgi:glycosyltransferase involved in cell wall biosynthesis
LASGCLIIGSATPPVLEVLRDGENGFAVDFFSHRALANRIETALEDAQRHKPLRQAAREAALQHFDLKRVILPRWMSLFDDLAHGRRPAPA